MRAVTWIEFSQITSILFKASLPALWVLTLSNSISQPQYNVPVKLTSTSALFPGNIDCYVAASNCQIYTVNATLFKLQSWQGRADMNYRDISLWEREVRFVREYWEYPALSSVRSERPVSWPFCPIWVITPHQGQYVQLQCPYLIFTNLYTSTFLLFRLVLSFEDGEYI